MNFVNTNDKSEYALEYRCGKLREVQNPLSLYMKDNPGDYESYDDIYPEGAGYSHGLTYNKPDSLLHPGILLEVYRRRIEDDRPCFEYPYLVQIIFNRERELVCLPDIQSLIEFYDKVSLIFDLNPQEV